MAKVMKIDFNKLPYKYWRQKTKLDYLQRIVILHSYLYYVLDNPLLTDKSYDEVAQQLVQLSKEAGKNTVKQTQYYYCFYDFDGSTGFDIPYRLKNDDKRKIEAIAYILLNQSKEKIR